MLVPLAGHACFPYTAPFVEEARKAMVAAQNVYREKIDEFVKSVM